MPHSTHIPFYSVSLRLADGSTVSMPLTDMGSLHVDKTPEALAKRFRERFQRKQLDQGKYISVMNLLQQGGFSQKKLLVNFPPSKDGITYPAFTVELDCFYQNTAENWWGFLPALSLEAIAAGEAELEDRLQEVVRVEFTAKKRLQAVQYILAAAWYEEASIVQTDIELNFHSPAELSELQKEKKQLLLPLVAEKLEIKKQVAYGREAELGLMERILKSRFNRNILLMGASGTGKTALIWEMAHRSPKLGIDGAFWETTASMMVKELTRETGWQDNLSLLVKELGSRQGDILFVRNLAELFEVGRYEGNEVSMAEYLRPFLGRGELTIITECTPEERARIELRSPNYLSFFQIIQLEEPKQGLTSIIHQKINDIAEERHIAIELEAIHEIIRLHRRFSPYSGMPGKPIRFLESIVLGQLNFSQNSIPAARKNGAATLDRKTLIQYYCQESGMPAFMVDPDLPMDLPAVRNFFEQNIFGQERAVKAVVDMLSAVKTSLTKTGKPIASFLFIGPTGVGKTELAKVLAGFMFGSRDRLLRFDMSEYSDPYAVLRLTGDGYYSDGLLTAAVRRQPFCVLLFDEIEKAAPNFYDLLLQILGEGRLTDSRGKLVNFCSAIIIMTSNIGASSLQSGRIGWSKGQDIAETTGHFTRAAEQHFRPELFNRIDSIVAFEPLSRNTVRHVVQREIGLLRQREGIQFRRLDLDIAEAVMDYLTEKGFDPKYGARYLQRTIREELVVPLAQVLNTYDYDERLLVKVAIDDGKISIRSEADPLGFDLLMEQWDKLTLAETASAFRRHIVRLLEGPMFMRLQSELDLLEQKKKRQDSKFWEDGGQAKYFANLTGTKDVGSQLHQRIEDLEMSLALASMDQVPFEAGLAGQLEQWEADLLAFKVALYAILHPKHNTCCFGIYGPEVEPLLRFYLEVFALKGWTVNNAKTIWFREGRPSDQARKKLADSPANGPASEIATETPANKQYRKLAWKIPGKQDAIELKPEHKNDLWCGVELEVEGEAIWPWLKPETGVQEWSLQDRELPMLFMVQASPKEIQVPDGVHRLTFFTKEKPRRKLAETWIIDKNLGINNTIQPVNRAAFMVDKLDERFRQFLDQLLLG